LVLFFKKELLSSFTRLPCFSALRAFFGNQTEATWAVTKKNQKTFEFGLSRVIIPASVIAPAGMEAVTAYQSLRR
jgi:hypothetical protein